MAARDRDEMGDAAGRKVVRQPSRVHGPSGSAYAAGDDRPGVAGIRVDQPECSLPGRHDQGVDAFRLPCLLDPDHAHAPGDAPEAVRARELVIGVGREATHTSDHHSDAILILGRHPHVTAAHSVNADAGLASLSADRRASLRGDAQLPLAHGSL